MANTGVPRFPDRALISRGVLYRPLQDIEIYIEDEDSEVFYSELLTRLLGGEVRLNKVFALRGKRRVLEECRRFTGPASAIFLIDGDLDWVAGIPLPQMERLFVHQSYCIENYLFCETAMVEIIVESHGRLTRDKARRKLDWPKIRESYQAPLTDLFIEFAVAYSINPDLPTVSTGVGSVCTQPRRKSPPGLDKSKVSSLCAQTREAVIQAVGLETYQRTRDTIAGRVSEMADPFDAVSGKAYLVPLQLFILKRFSSQNISRQSLVFRLAKYCRLERLVSLKKAILLEASTPKPRTT